MIPLSFDELNVRFSYDPSTGELTHKFMAREHFASVRAFKRHNVFVGRTAGCANDKGYSQVNICGRKVKAHRVAWVLGNKRPVPAGCEIDHINGDRTDNRLDNLRAVSKSANQRNAGRRIDNTSGEPGVTFHPRTGKWQVRIRVGDERKYIGLFPTVEAAAKARDAIRKDNGYILTDRASRNLELALANSIEGDMQHFVVELNRQDKRAA